MISIFSFWKCPRWTMTLRETLEVATSHSKSSISLGIKYETLQNLRCSFCSLISCQGVLVMPTVTRHILSHFIILFSFLH